MKPAVGPYRTPAELRDYLLAADVQLLGTYEYPSGRPAIRIVADPHGAIDDITRWAIGYWERELWACLTGRVPLESRWPDAVTIGRSARGRPTIEYRRTDGSQARYLLRRDGRWQAW